MVNFTQGGFSDSMPGGEGHLTTRKPRELRDRTVTFDFFLGENKRRRRRGETRRGEERDEGDDKVEKMRESGAEVKRVMEQEQCRQSGRGG